MGVGFEPMEFQSIPHRIGIAFKDGRRNELRDDQAGLNLARKRNIFVDATWVYEILARFLQSGDLVGNTSLKNESWPIFHDFLRKII